MPTIEDPISARLRKRVLGVKVIIALTHATCRAAEFSIFRGTKQKNIIYISTSDALDLRKLRGIRIYKSNVFIDYTAFKGSHFNEVLEELNYCLMN